VQRRAAIWLWLASLACSRGDDTRLSNPGTAADAVTQPDEPASSETDSDVPALVLPRATHLVPSGKAAPAGACQTAADCSAGWIGPNGADFPPVPGECSEIVPGGYRVCTYHPPFATEPSGSLNGGGDECDGSRPCSAGNCYRVEALITPPCYDSSAAWLNRCRSDECASDADCPGGVCGPPGFSRETLIRGGFIRQCIPAACRSNLDCTAQPGGVCALIGERCEPTDGPSVRNRPAELACVYADGCTGNDCPIGSCIVTGGQAVCVAH
jgi:hypothetical protein